MTDKLTNRLEGTVKNSSNTQKLITVGDIYYVNRDDMMFWAYLCNVVCTPYNYIPDEGYEDDSFENVEEEFVAWIKEMIYLKTDSLYPDKFRLNPKEKRILNQVEHSSFEEWFDIFKKNRTFFQSNCYREAIDV